MKDTKANTTAEDVGRWFVRHGIYRNPNKAVIAGVISGIADRTKWDANAMRLLFVVIMIITAIVPFLIIYIIMWMIMPLRDTSYTRRSSPPKPHRKSTERASHRSAEAEEAEIVSR